VVGAKNKGVGHVQPCAACAPERAVAAAPDQLTLHQVADQDPGRQSISGTAPSRVRRHRNSMVNTPAARPAAGYVTSPQSLARVWHGDPQCRARPVDVQDGGLRPVIPINAANFVAMHGEQGRHGCTACMLCALPAVLDDLSDDAEKPGYHALVCASWHEGEACTMCTTLTRYAGDRNALAATRSDGHVAVLRKGTPRAADGDLLGGYLGGVAVRTATGNHLPEISEPMWDSAANLLGGRTTLMRALQAAAGLYTAPTR